MQAYNRRLPDWFNRIRNKQITLPRFQRYIAWGHGEISGLLTTVLRGLPSGAALILEVGDQEKFPSRTMMDAPETGERVVEQLLDGQQRLTALWRSLHDTFLDRTYLIGFEADPADDTKNIPYVYGQARWMKNGNKYPMWVDSPLECWKKGLVPIKLLRPDEGMDKEKEEWIENAIATVPEETKFVEYKRLSGIINDLKIKVREFNLPYLSLPVDTSKEVALDVFIKMNTSSVQLSTYDIIVALVESETGKSLHEHVNDLRDAVPRASDYADLPGLVLDVVALRQDRVPTQAGYKGIDYTKMLEDWDIITKSIKGMVGFLEDESIFDAQRLPSYTPLPVIAALWECMPTSPDQLGNARITIRKYLWRSFLTSRYEQSSTTNALQDFRAMKSLLNNEEGKGLPPLFDEELYPIPTKDYIARADWPKNKSILGRGLLCLQLKFGAEDLADGVRATKASITSSTSPREYHHLYPASLLERANIPYEKVYKAMNCALITWKTNRTISNKDPMSYLNERSANGLLGADELRRRLKTHMIPFEELAVDFSEISDDLYSVKVSELYEEFIGKRSEIFQNAIKLVCEGRQLNESEIFC